MSTNFSAEIYQQRIQALQQRLVEDSLDAMFLGSGPLMQSLIGIGGDTHERLAALIIPAQGQVQALFPTTDDAQIAQSQIPDMDIEVHYWRDGEDPYQRCVQIYRSCGAKKNPTKIGINAELRADHILGLQQLLDAEFTIADSLFAVKAEEELEQLRLVGEAIDRVHAQVPGWLQPGRTEAEVAADLRQAILEEHEAVDFIIVGSGPHGAQPHHDYSDRILDAGEIVVVDIGGTNAYGYHSDCTRTYIVGGGGAKDSEQARAYQVLQEAQEKAVTAVRPGRTAAEIDAIARDHISAAGFGEYFSHRTGHGIGVSTHEPPFIIAGNELELREGMVFSIEPGIYIPGKWGMRIEDIVAVTTDGAQRYNNQPRDLR